MILFDYNIFKLFIFRIALALALNQNNSDIETIFRKFMSFIQLIDRIKNWNLEKDINFETDDIK